MPATGLEADLDKVLGALTNLFASDGDARAVALLALATPSILETDSRSDWGQHYTGFTIYLQVPQNLYHQVGSDIQKLEEQFTDRIREIVRLYELEWVQSFVITTELEHDPQWREKAKAYVSGQGINNQGRVRSDNLAPRQCDGLLFRSDQEIHLYRALRSSGVAVAPLPVFIRGGQTYRRIEVDFLIIKDGITLVVEVDGDTVHRESPREAHERLTMLTHEGVHVERVNAADCETPDKAKACAQKILQVIQKMRTNK
jgi:hypothetical protein